MSRRRLTLAALLLSTPLAAAAPLAAQTDSAAAAATAPAPKLALSLNPIFAMFGVYSGQIERAVGTSTTLSLGGSYWDAGGDGEVEGGETVDGRVTYVTTDAHLRYYPSGTVLRGFSFGVSGGWTRLGGDFSTREDESHGHVSGATFGVELAHNWLLGSRSNVVLSTALGAKRIFIREADNVSAAYPTARLGLGVAF